MQKATNQYKAVGLTDAQRVAFRLWLQREFTERCKRNPKYSLRAFAKMLHLDASSLSQILSGRRPFSKKSITEICEKLSPSPKELKMFGLLTAQSQLEDDYYQVNIDTFSVISDWYHYAILELTYVDGFNSDPKWISNKLSITTQEAKSAVERLLRLKLLTHENGMLKKTNRALTNHLDVPSGGARKEFQRQVVQKALSAIDNCEPNEKDITSMTMAVDVERLDEARELIKKFRRELCTMLENGNPTRVYNLAVQLYPISKKSEESV